MAERALPKSLKEQVALVVSGLNFSSYCLAIYVEVLGRMGMDKALSRKLAVNYLDAPAEPRVMELFRFADKLTRRPGKMEKSDVDRLRDVGWSEEEIVEAVLAISVHHVQIAFPQDSACSRISSLLPRTLGQPNVHLRRLRASKSEWLNARSGIYRDAELARSLRKRLILVAPAP